MKNLLPLLVIASLLTTSLNGLTANIDFIRVPNGGIQPQVVVGKDGTLHLVYFDGEPAGGNLFYVKRASSSSMFSHPIRINDTAASAVALGTIRGAHLALGQNDRVHVAWMGSSQTASKGKGNHPESPMFYTRSNEDGSAFETERNVIQWTGGLDGGGSVAADSLGNVYVAWHGRAPDAAEGEVGRAMYLAVSADAGKTFKKEVQANPTPTGSCGCCGMRAYVDSAENLHLLYRTVSPLSRDMLLLTSPDHGQNFRATQISRWATQSCPMSSSFMSSAPQGLFILTESNNQIEWDTLSMDQMTLGIAKSVSSAKAKHPSIATNAKGEALAAWAEGAAWAKGGTLRWQMFAAGGESTDIASLSVEIPTWSFPVVATMAGSDFVIIY